MAIDIAARLRARRNASFHVQILLESIRTDVLPPGEVSVTGRVSRIFRSDGRLALGDRIAFGVHALRAGESAPPGAAHLSLDELARATHFEAYLNGTPPDCHIASDECIIPSGPLDQAEMSELELEQLLANSSVVPNHQSKLWWQFWKK